MQAVKQHEHPLVFATISGAHLYGFASPDSDYDLRGVHVLPVDAVIGLDPGSETIELASKEDGVELDLVTHDIKKFVLLMLKRNGYVLEQLYSPLVLKTSPAHAELKTYGQQCITKHHSHHYLGFAQNQWNLFEKESPRRVKPLLYVYRVLLTGILLMRTGTIEANLPKLNERFHLEYIEELIERKTKSSEKQTLTDADIEFHEAEYLRLSSQLEEESASSSLPDAPTAKAALDDLLKRVRKNHSSAT
jgi:predicted nucleotidyltransferase